MSICLPRNGKLLRKISLAIMNKISLYSTIKEWAQPLCMIVWMKTFPKATLLLAHQPKKGF